MNFEYNGSTLTRNEAREYLDKMVKKRILERDSSNRYKIIEY